MRLPDRINMPDWLGYSILVPVLIGTAPIWLLVAGMLGLQWLKRKAIGPHYHWSRWFAWYPVDTGWDGRRWLEWVERRSSHLMSDTQYRLSGPSA